MAANTNALTYNGYVTQVGLLAVVDTSIVSGVASSSNSAAFNAMIPAMLDYAELRIQRDMDMLPLQSSNDYALTAGASDLTLSVDDFVTVQTLAVSVNGDPAPLLPASIPFIQSVYPNTGPSSWGPPTYFAMYGGDFATGGATSNVILLGPTPDNAYPITVSGTVRAPSLNKFNTAPQAGTATTFISTYLPDLLLMASLIYISGYQRNFGKISDDPAMAVSYEQQYSALLQSARAEEFRKKFAGDAWTSEPPSTVASPTRAGG